MQGQGFFLLQMTRPLVHKNKVGDIIPDNPRKTYYTKLTKGSNPKKPRLLLDIVQKGGGRGSTQIQKFWGSFFGPSFVVHLMFTK